MIACSIALALWTAVLANTTAKLAKKRKAEFGVTQGVSTDHKIADEVDVEGTTGGQAVPAKSG